MLRVNKIIGPAASGKTTALQAIQATITLAGGRVIFISGDNTPVEIHQACMKAFRSGPADQSLTILIDDATEAMADAFQGLPGENAIVFMAITR